MYFIVEGILNDFKFVICQNELAGINFVPSGKTTIVGLTKILFGA